MKKRLLCFLLAALMVLGMAAVSPVQARAESLMTTSDALVDLLKEFEGFSKYPYWDYSLWTVGFGTRCPEDQLERYTNEGITEEEAEALLREHIAIAESAVNRFIDKFSLTVNQGQFDCMICFSFNCGTSWLNKSGTLRNAIIEGKTGNDFLYAMCLWCWAGNKIQPGLVERRLIEANIYLNGI